MATDVERLVVAMEARTASFEKALNRANGVANRRATSIEKRFKDMNKNISGSFKNMLRSGIAMAGIGLGVSEIQKMADAWTDMSSRVGLAVKDMDAAPKVMDRIYDMAQRTYSGLEQTAEAFLGNATALGELGYSTNQQLDFTEALNNALVVSGAKAQRAASVNDALSKAMAFGSLQGQNLNTVIQTGGRVAEALAEELGIGVNQLRQFGKDGKITGEVIYNSLTKRLETLRGEADAMPATIADGFLKIQNALTKFVGTMDQANEVSGTLAQGLVFVADNFDHVAMAAAAAAAVLLSSYIPTLARLGVASVGLVATNPFLLLATAIGGAAYALSAFGDEIRPIEGEMANLQDYAATAWDDIKTGASDMAQVTKDAFLSVINFLTKMMGDTKAEWSDVGAFITNEIDGLIGAFKGLVAETKVIFNDLPAAIAEYVVDAMNSMIANVEAGLQKALDGINAVSRALNYIDSLVGIGPTLKEDFKIDLGRVENTYRGAGKAASEAWNKALAEGDKKHFTEYLAKNRQMANIRARERQADGKSDDILGGLGDSLSKGGAKPTAPSGGDTSKGKGQKGRKERKNDLQKEIEQIKERTASLQAETAAQAQLNPLINDYEYSITKARATQELLNAAKKAGIEITPALQEQIEELAEAYAQATVASNQLAESQEQARQASDFLKGSMMDAFQSMIPVIETGNKALDGFLNTLMDAVNQALLLGKGPLAGLFGGGTGLLGTIFGFAKGGVAAHGRPQPMQTFARGGVSRTAAIFGEAGPEAAVPLPDGRRIPVDLKMPNGSGGGAQNVHVTVGVSTDGNGNLMPFVESVARNEASRSTAQLSKNIPTMVDNRSNARQVRGTRG